MTFRSVVKSIRDFVSKTPAPSVLAEGLNPVRPLSAMSTSEAQLARQDYSGRVENANNIARGNWAQRLDDAGHRIGFAYTCICGLSFNHFPQDASVLQEGSGAKCDGCKKPFDFEGDLHLRVDSIADENEAFKIWLAKFGGAITTADFNQRADGKYELRYAARRRVFDALPQLRFDADVAPIGNLTIPVGEGDGEATYEQSDPGAKNPLMASGNPPASRSWLLQRAYAQLRHAQAYGTAAEVRAAEQKIKQLENRDDNDDDTEQRVKK